MYFYPCVPNRISIHSNLFDMFDKAPQVIAEQKRNGWRCLIEKENGVITLWTRHFTIINDPLPELREEIKELLQNRDNCLLDGELIEKRTKETKGLYYLFDIILGHDHFAAYGLPLWQRRAILEEIFDGREGEHIELAQQFHMGKRELYWRSIEGEVNEGIVLKDVNSKYPVGRAKCETNVNWMKVKKEENHLFVGGTGCQKK